jgi:kinetochore protein Spc7/SPC105
MEIELDKERQEEEKRESERKLWHNNADEEKDATVNLKEMIKSLTPKKVNGRKSLAVGAARGLLGKRPAELDEDDESDGSVKKVRAGKETSPVKSVKLRPPPSKVETTGRITRRSLVGVSPSTTPASGSPANNETPSTTPKRQRGSENAGTQPSSVKRTSASDETAAFNNDSQLEEEVEEKVHLQDFLNLTSIRFMELNTTKRRYTVAQSNALEGSRNNSRPLADGSEPNNDDAKRDLETCVVAGACTIPMLELYQHVGFPLP